MFIFLKKLCLIFFCLFSRLSILNSGERILSFDVVLTVHEDASMEVQETITVFSAMKNIKRGIVREIPTVYKDYGGAKATIGFVLKQVLQDGKLVPYKVKDEKQGKVIEIGTDEKITPGKHVYKINYRVNRHLGFFKDYDELYWNVTGSNWRLPIDRVSASVVLPKKIPADSIKIEGYTGKHGTQEKDFIVKQQESKIIFSTTRIFKKFEGFTISVSWPKGFVKEPNLKEKLYWFFYDNIFFVIVFFCFFALLFILLYLIYMRYFYHENGTIIPLFYPPALLTPSQVGYINKLVFEERLFAADIVDLAIRGFIEIDYESGKWFGGTYILKKKKNSEENIKNNEEHDQLILSNLFSSADTIKVTVSYKKQLQGAVKNVYDYCKNTLRPYIRKTYMYDIIAMIVFVPMFLIVVQWYKNNFLGAFILFLSLIMINFIIHFSKFYTEKGQELANQIEGFKLFLTTTEVEKMNIVGTPPTKTPELYEKYLPYAIALGVEKQWTQQFAAVFKDLEKSGRPYVYSWYPGKNFNFAHFGSSFPAAFTSHIRSSGVGGKGSSGGGRGGGGGGGR